MLTCFIAVTMMTKKSGSPLVTGLVGVSIINWEIKCHIFFIEYGFQQKTNVNKE